MSSTKRGVGARRSRPDPADGARLRGRAHEQVSGIQRQRLLSATAEVVAERGSGSVTVAHIVARSGVSRRTFYELFADREDCLLAALDQAIERASAAVVPTYGQGGRWRERMRRAVMALLAFLEEEPAPARLIVVEALGAGPPALARRTRIVRALIAAVEEGRGELKPGSEAPALAAEGVVGAVLADQGQISKLLTRLQNLGLIENAGEGQAKGAPNAWRLTAKGLEVEQPIRTDVA
jgi:AcrR family transcriptional regulator